MINGDNGKMHIRRRIFIIRTLKSAAIIAAGLTGLLRPLVALAARNTAAFTADSETGALAQLFPDREIMPSEKITIGAHDLVENGAVVPVSIETSLPDVSSISVLADKNPNPLIAKFNLTPQCEGFIATRLKVAEPSNIVAVVESGGNLYSARKYIEVVAGGCG